MKIFFNAIRYILGLIFLFISTFIGWPLIIASLIPFCLILFFLWALRLGRTSLEKIGEKIANMLSFYLDLQWEIFLKILGRNVSPF